MTLFNRREVLTAAAGLCVTLGAANAAEDYPSKPVRFITPNSAGSGADGMTRRLADHFKGR